MPRDRVVDVNTNILVTSYLFAPQNKIGAVRPSKIVKYLVRSGFKVTVICCAPVDENKDLTLYSKESDDAIIYYIPHSWMYKKVISIINNYMKLKKKVSKVKLEKNRLVNRTEPVNGRSRNEISIKANIKYYLYFCLSVLESIDWYWQVNKWLRENKKSLNNFDLLFSSYWPFSSHWVGNLLFKKNLAKLWLADFRDPMTVDSRPYYAKKISQKWQNDVIRKASGITTVSNGMKDHILSSYKGSYKNAFVLSNGFDREDILDNEGEGYALSKNKLHIGYTGVLYDGRRDLRPLFRAIRELIKEASIDEDKVCFHYAGDDGTILESQATDYFINSIIVNHGRVNRKMAMSLQRRCNILVVASWNTRTEKGVLTGKVFEYLLANVPIISLVSGDIIGSEIANIIKECDAGISYEMANDSEDFIKLKEYILGQYNAVLAGSNIAYKPNSDEIKKYEYSNIANELVKIYENICKEEVNEKRFI